jgi:methyl-accepting chemotaxis protein
VNRARWELIAQSTENITGMIQQIKRACDEQAKGSEQIVYAMEGIQKSTGENIESVGVLDEAFAGLSCQIETLTKKCGGSGLMHKEGKATGRI